MDKKGSLFSIGRTARLFRLSVSSLRHYEAIGLVRPAWTDPASGYRYYSLAQFEVLNTIRYLRTLDMPLEQIRSFLENRDPAWMEGRLRQQQKEVRRRIRELELAEGKITSRLEQLQEARKGTKGVITLTESPALRPAAVPGQPPGGSGTVPEAVGFPDRKETAACGVFPGSRPDRCWSQRESGGICHRDPDPGRMKA